MSELEKILEFLDTHPNTCFSITKNPESIDEDGAYAITIATRNSNDNDTPKTNIAGVTRQNMSFCIGTMLEAMNTIFE